MICWKSKSNGFKNKSIKLACFLLFILNGLFVSGQDLPQFYGDPNGLSNMVEFANISIDKNKYKFDDSIQFGSVAQIGHLLCEKEKKSDDQFSWKYISLSIDKKTSMVVVDSVLNELSCYGILTVYYKTVNSSLTGFVYSLLPENKERTSYFELNKYYAPKYKMEDCLNSAWQVEWPVDMPLPPPPPPAPKINYPVIIIPQLKLDSIYEGKKVYFLSKHKSGFVVNGSIYDEINANTLVQEIIKSQKYLIVLEINKVDTYNDYISLISLCFYSLYHLREVNTDQIYGLYILNYSISDKKYLKLNEN